MKLLTDQTFLDGILNFEMEELVEDDERGGHTKST